MKHYKLRKKKKKKWVKNKRKKSSKTEKKIFRGGIWTYIDKTTLLGNYR